MAPSIHRFSFILLMTALLFLLPQCNCKTIHYYSNDNTTFARMVDELYTHEFCGYALAQRFTPTGLKVSSLPVDLKKRLNSFYERSIIRQKQPEPLNDFVWQNDVENSAASPSLLNLVSIMLDMPLKLDLENAIRFQLEEWTGTSRLMHTATYGVREYTRGAVLKPHVDRFRTHILSAIINVRQDVDEQWPLVAFDHNNERHEIFMNDTMDVVLYESATVIHGRPYPLKGNSYANIFLHFAPIGWERAVGDQIQACIDQTAFLCPDHADTCDTAKLGHYITDHNLIIDACDHNQRAVSRHPPY